jgi:polysaccharide export outer membrane protein
MHGYKLFIVLTISVTCMLMVVGCSGKSRTGAALPQTPQQVYIPGVSPPPPEYQIGFGDVLEVKFFYDPELNETLLVRSDGRITLPRLGDIIVAGLTPTHLDSIITEKYSEILKNPDITIQVRNSAEQVVYVLGEVRQPGAVPVRGKMTALQAIAASGGFTYISKPSSVIIFHSNGIDKPSAQRLNLSRALNRRSIKENITLSGYDIVYVPKSFIGKLDIFVDQFFSSMLEPMLRTYLRGYDAYRIKDRYDFYKRRAESIEN